MQRSLHLAVEVPTLETDRLILRGHRGDDFAECAAMWADVNVTRHILDHPLSEEASWTRFLRYFGHWAVLGFGYWAIEEKQSGKFVGEAGFADYKREIEPSLKDVPEIGWVLASHAHGKGYATETVRAMTQWGDAHFEAFLDQRGRRASSRPRTWHRSGSRRSADTVNGSGRRITDIPR